MSKETLVAIDIETTGLNPGNNEIIEVAAVRFLDGQVVDSFQSLVRPKGNIPLKIQRLTGISEEMVASAPECSEVIVLFEQFINDSSVVGHNVNFDLAFLKAMGVNEPVKTYDTCQLARMVWPTVSSYKLESLTHYFKIDVPGSPHRALHDATTAKELFCLTEKALLDLGAEILMKILDAVGEGFKWNYHDYFTALALKSGYKSGRTFWSPGMTDFKEGLFADKDVCLNGLEQQNHSFSTETELFQLFQPEGPFNKIVTGYQYRPQQLEMCQRILNCFKFDQHAVIEAGTGTGKSLAYLLPAIFWQSTSGSKVVISTHTINLQEQLWNQDIPNLSQVLSSTVNAALVKGRSNYLCMRKLDQRINEKGWSDEREINFYVKTLVWLSQTKTGDYGELNLNSEEQECWHDISGDQDTCLGIECKWFNKHCFVMKAKREAENADLLIVNHSLLFADMKSENNVLPEYRHVIIDEAHHLEETATEYLGYEVSGSTLRKFLRYLNKEHQGGRPGLLIRLRKFLTDILAADNNLLEKANSLISDLVAIKKDTTMAQEEFMQQAKTFVAAYRSEEEQEVSAITLRVRPCHLQEKYWRSLEVVGENLLFRLTRLAETLAKLEHLFLNEHIQDEHREAVGLAREINYLVNSFRTYTREMRFILSASDEDFVYWFQVGGMYKEDVVLKAAPIKINCLLWDKFFKEKKSVILTSATLSVEGGFDHYLKKTGLDLAPPDTVESLLVTSPFKYEKQSLLCVVNDLPNPAEIDDAAYAEEITPVLAQVAKLLQGRTLCLFSSHRLLRETYARLASVLEDEGITVLGHNIDGGRRGLVEEFKKNDKSVLLGASSFWEGVDLPGNLLSCVVIVKIPFSPPNIPTVEARVEKLQAENLDGFYAYSVPQAVIKLKQGFGRLIRKEDDSGVVVILDKRIVQKRYGKVFLRSLPLKTHLKGDRYLILQKIKDWLEGERNHFEGINFLHDYSDIEKFLQNKKNIP